MTAIAIAGMHRSGTSMVAHALKLAGVSFGEESDLFEPTPDNPDGYWEHLRFVQLNDEILTRLGGGWERPPAVPAGFDDDERLRGLKSKAKELVGEFEGKDPWAWKDPRTSLTLDLWGEVVPDLSVVVCLRNPLEVTLSLRRRAMFSYANALELWETYYRRLLDASAEGRRMVTDYESYFSRPRTEFRRLLGFAGVSATRSTLDQACAAVNTDLRHNSFTVQDLLDVDVAPEIVELYLALRREAGLRDPARRRPAAARQPAEEESARTEPVVDVEALDLTALRQYVKTLESIVAVRELELGYVKDGREAEQRAWQAEEQRWKGVVEARERELARLQQELGRAAGAAEQADREQALLETQQRLRGEIAELGSLLGKRLLPELEELHGSVYDLQAEADPSKPEYRKVVRRVREVVREHVPFDSTILVVSKGDEDLLKLYGRRAWHFPRTDTGVYTGYYPKSDLSVVAHLEMLRARGADHVVFPEPSFWWLEHYPDFRRHLESRYRSAARDDACVIFELRPRYDDAEVAWRRDFREVLDQYRLTFGRDPSVLDWNTGLELERLFPEHVVFSPPASSNGLPYLDGTVDIVAMLDPSATSEALEEADRVASAAVLVVSEGSGNGYRLEGRWKVEHAELPSVSIVVPCYNGIEHTGACLSTLRETLPRSFRGEIIVVDDASTDGTAELLEDLARVDNRITVLRNSQNRGFLESANRGAGEAASSVLVFLNNDTILLPGWLEPLLRVFADHADAGVVGGRLLYPDGRLQEAGGLVFADGSAWKYGYGDLDPGDPLYDYFRSVDYCSGCLFATRRSLFAKLGGFDTRYAPGFYEDADYCFAVREQGLRTYYEPQSSIIHVEGATAGTDLSRGPKRHQASNRLKFVEKWREALGSQPERPETLDGWALAPLVGAREGSR
jgi:GT2 family glycosyltransferase